MHLDVLYKKVFMLKNDCCSIHASVYENERRFRSVSDSVFEWIVDSEL